MDSDRSLKRRVSRLTPSSTADDLHRSIKELTDSLEEAHEKLAAQDQSIASLSSGALAMTLRINSHSQALTLALHNRQRDIVFVPEGWTLEIDGKITIPEFSFPVTPTYACDVWIQHNIDLAQGKTTQPPPTSEPPRFVDQIQIIKARRFPPSTDGVALTPCHKIVVTFFTTLHALEAHTAFEHKHPRSKGMAKRTVCMLPHRAEAQRIAARGTYAKHHVNTSSPVTPQQQQLNEDASHYEETRALASRDNADALSRMCNLHVLHGFPSAKPLFSSSHPPVRGAPHATEAPHSNRGTPPL
jgi:hypothetical protein